MVRQVEKLRIHKPDKERDYGNVPRIISVEGREWEAPERHFARHETSFIRKWALALVFRRCWWYNEVTHIEHISVEEWFR